MAWEREGEVEREREREGERERPGEREEAAGRSVFGEGCKRRGAEREKNSRRDGIQKPGRRGGRGRGRERGACAPAPPTLSSLLSPTLFSSLPPPTL
eukprot:scaffold65309_cov32-Tisochrysis_lutea.AAC.1